MCPIIFLHSSNLFILSVFLIPVISVIDMNLNIRRFSNISSKLPQVPNYLRFHITPGSKLPQVPKYPRFHHIPGATLTHVLYYPKCHPPISLYALSHGPGIAFCSHVITLYPKLIPLCFNLIQIFPNFIPLCPNLCP